MQVTPSLRASDSDREQAAERLRHATAEGRLSGDEFEQRLEALYATRTYGEIDALLADLPVKRSVRQPRVRLGRLIAAVSAVTLVLAVLGVLAVGRVHSSFAISGTRRPAHLVLPGHVAGPRPALMIATLLGVAVVALLAFGALLWAVMGSRSSRQP